MSERSDLAADVAAALRTIADFPRQGILFQDITPVLADADLFRRVTDAMAEPYRAAGVTHVAAIESRGFLFGAPIAQLLAAALVPVRKPGKLPAATRRVDYALEYGVDALEAHIDACGAGSRILIVDDVLATGGTARATIELLESLGAAVAGCSFLLEIDALAGRKRLAPAQTSRIIGV